MSAVQPAALALSTVGAISSGCLTRNTWSATPRARAASIAGFAETLRVQVAEARARLDAESAYVDAERPAWEQRVDPKSLPKDLGDNLKRIEKLAKDLRKEVVP